MSGGYAPGENPWITHWRRVAVAEGVVIADLRRLHQREMRGGMPTGRCLCGLPAPCPTAELIGAYTATLNDPCSCMRDSGGHCPAAH